MKIRRDELAKKIGDLIYTNRSRKNISQVQLAQMIGCTQGTLSKIENGMSQPNVYVWIKLTSFFKGLRPSVEKLEEFTH
jgi:DNA-binding XRE family transcriptional regulator